MAIYGGPEDIEKEQQRKEAEEYEEALNKIALEELEKSKHFIQKMADTLYCFHEDMDFGVAYASASTLLSACMFNVKMKTRRGLTPLTEMNIIIAGSGEVKTIPLKKIRKIAIELGIRAAEQYTTEGIEGHYADKVQVRDPVTKLMVDTDEYRHQPYGIMVIDELSQLIKEANVKKHFSGIIEMISQFYDNQLRYTVLRQGDRLPQNPYVCVLGATIPEFIPFLDDFFFQQGFVGRFYWTYVETKAPKLKTGRISDYDTYEQYDTELEGMTEVLKILLKMNVYSFTCEKPKHLLIKISPQVDDAFNKYEYVCFSKHYMEKKSKPYGYHFQYLKRVPEMALRTAGRIAMSKSLKIIISEEDITKFKELTEEILKDETTDVQRENLEKEKNNLIKKLVDDFPEVTVTLDDWEEAENIVEQSINSLNKIIHYKANQELEQKSIPKVFKHSAETIKEILFTFPNNMATSQMIIDKLGWSPKTVRGFLDVAVNEKHLVKLVDIKEITDNFEKERLLKNPKTGKINTNVKIWTVNKFG